MNDFQAIAVPQLCFIPAATGHNFAVLLQRHTISPKSQFRHQCRYWGASLHVAKFARNTVDCQQQA